jgi:hypothetical protein
MLQFNLHKTLSLKIVPPLWCFQLISCDSIIVTIENHLSMIMIGGEWSLFSWEKHGKTPQMLDPTGFSPLDSLDPSKVVTKQL